MNKEESKIFGDNNICNYKGNLIDKELLKFCKKYIDWMFKSGGLTIVLKKI